MKMLSECLAAALEQLAVQVRSGSIEPPLTLDGVAVEIKEPTKGEQLPGGEDAVMRPRGSPELVRRGRCEASQSGFREDPPPVHALHLPLRITHRRVPAVWLRNAVELSNGS